MVMGRDSRIEGHGFESQCRILDGHFFTLICCKIVLMLNEKEAGMAHFFKKKHCHYRAIGKITLTKAIAMTRFVRINGALDILLSKAVFTLVRRFTQ